MLSVNQPPAAGIGGGCAEQLIQRTPPKAARAVVRAMDAEKVVLDANHPFAGADVFFKVTLLGVNVDEA